MNHPYYTLFLLLAGIPEKLLLKSKCASSLHTEKVLRSSGEDVWTFYRVTVTLLPPQSGLLAHPEVFYINDYTVFFV